jgi:hypothetical protein
MAWFKLKENKQNETVSVDNFTAKQPEHILSPQTVDISSTIAPETLDNVTETKCAVVETQFNEFILETLATEQPVSASVTEQSVPTHETENLIPAGLSGILPVDILLLMKQLAKDFEVKLKYDASKQQLIDKLYTENQNFKEGIVKKFRHTMILAVIEQIDDAAKQTTFFTNAEFTEDNYRKLLANYCDIAEGFQNMLLEKFDVNAYRCETETPFDAKRQRSLKTTPTDDQTKHKLIKQSLRPGYETDDGFVLRPELVEVYVFTQ